MRSFGASPWPVSSGPEGGARAGGRPESRHSWARLLGRSFHAEHITPAHCHLLVPSSRSSSQANLVRGKQVFGGTTFSLSPAHQGADKTPTGRGIWTTFWTGAGEGSSWNLCLGGTACKADSDGDGGDDDDDDQSWRWIWRLISYCLPCRRRRRRRRRHQRHCWPVWNCCVIGGN